LRRQKNRNSFVAVFLSLPMMSNLTSLMSSPWGAAHAALLFDFLQDLRTRERLLRLV
jgi:hypothetical protein